MRKLKAPFNTSYIYRFIEIKHLNDVIIIIMIIIISLMPYNLKTEYLSIIFSYVWYFMCYFGHLVIQTKSSTSFSCISSFVYVCVRVALIKLLLAHIGSIIHAVIKGRLNRSRPYVGKNAEVLIPAFL